ncbi:MAG TPA: plasmid replication initiator TrfA [Candidatus Competibacteraceae bacterium]|nr:plasmid replication initiator TrfA [Candidatus Competibacteraceae bacterium]
MSNLEDALKKLKTREQHTRDQPRAEDEATDVANRTTVQEGEPTQVDTALAAALESLHRHWTERKAAEQQAAPTLPKAEQKEPLVLFPTWADNRRATAQAIFRSALFPALNFKVGRPFLKEKRIAAVDGVTVFFTGEQFDQSDLDVYLELLDITHETPFGVECTFTAYSLLKALGRATGQANHKWLHSVLIRLCSGTVDITDHRVRYFGHLVEGGIKDETTRHYTIKINPDFARFFKAGLWASLDIQQRRALGRNQTAKALHAYFSTHAVPTPHRYETLAEIAGLKNKTNPRKQKADLIKACEALKQVGLFSDYEGGAATIKVTVNQTPTQSRHVVRKLIKAKSHKRSRRDAK